MSPRPTVQRPSMRGVAFVLALALVALGVAFRSLDGSHTEATPASTSGSPGTSTPASVAPSTAPATSMPAAPTIDKDTFCASYAGLADAYNVTIMTSGDQSLLDRLAQAGEAFRSVGRPEDMGPMEDAGRDLFVADTLSAAGLRSDVDRGELAAQQLQAFSRYLTAACPGY